MRLTAFGTLLLILFAPPPAAISAALILDADGASAPPRIELLSSHSGSVDLRFILPSLEVESLEVDGRAYQHVSIPGGGFSGETGEPAIPTFTRLLVVPDGSGVVVRATIE